MDKFIKIEDFLIKKHEKYIENLNRISDDLLKAKWYFLAAISAIGLAYIYNLKDCWSIKIGIDEFFTKIINVNANPSNIDFQKYFAILFITIIGNIIFWLINEYILSHGFLFRYIQSNIATTELIYSKYFPDALNIDLIRNPTKKGYFIGNGKLQLDYLIPDQFIPLYWCSIWLIIINAILGISFNLNHFYLLIIIIFISLFLILKIISYHIYKINKFVNDYCDFEICHNFNNYSNKCFFQMPTWADYFKYGLLFLLIFIIIFYGLFFITYLKLFNLLIWPYSIFQTSILIVILYLLWFPIYGLFVHILKLFGQCEKWENRFPDAEGDRTIEITLKNESKFRWFFWLLFSVM